MVGKPQASEVWGGDMWISASEAAGAEEPPEPSELAEEGLLFPVRGKIAAVLGDAIEVSSLQGNKCILQELCQYPPLAARLVTSIKFQYPPGEDRLKGGKIEYTKGDVSIS